MQRQFPPYDRGGSEAKALTNVLPFEVRIVAEYVACRQSSCEQAQYSAHGNTQMPHARDTVHLCRVNRDAVEILHWLHSLTILYCPTLDRRRRSSIEKIVSWVSDAPLGR